MLRASPCFRGSYLLFRYLEADWRQPLQREECVNKSKEVLAAIQTNARNIELSKSASAMRRALHTFCKNGLTDDLSTALRFVRAHTPLAEFHLNMLFRCLAFVREKQACVNLAHLMMEKGTVDAESVAIAIGAIHTWHGRGRLSAILSLLRNVHRPVVMNNNNMNDSTAGGAAAADATVTTTTTLEEPLPLTAPWAVRTAWELALWPAPRRTSLPREPIDTDEFGVNAQQQQRQQDFQDEDTRENGAVAPLHPLQETKHLRLFHKEAITLSALLHALATGPEGALSALVAAVWIKAAGAELSAYDYFHVISAVARDAEDFDEIRRVFSDGARSGNQSEGCVTLSHIAQLLREGEAASPSAARERRFARLVADLAVEVMQSHDPSAVINPVYVGFLNRDARCADELIRHVFDEIHRRPTVGWGGESPANLHHAYAMHLINSRRDSLAVQELGHFLQRLNQREVNMGGSAGSITGNPRSPPPTSTPTGSVPAPRVRSLFHVRPPKADKTRGFFARAAPPMFPGDDRARIHLNMWFPKDVSFRFPFVARPVLEQTRPAYEELCTRAAPESDEVDTWVCWALGLSVLHRHEEVSAALDSVLQAFQKREQEKSLRLMVRSILHLLSELPPPGPVVASDYTIAERLKWGRYFEARDIGLALFGYTRSGRETMRRVFAEGGKLQAMRGPEMIASDTNDFLDLFQLDRAEANVDQRRLSLKSVFGYLPPVPEHLSSTANPFPLASARAPPPNTGNSTNNNGSKTRSNNGGPPKEDLFWKLHNFLSKQQDQWWFTENDTVAHYLRCLLVRLEWHKAVDIATQIAVKKGYQAGLDSAIHQIFEDMGDPVGAMCFKFASRFVDGRILDTTREGHTPRRKSLFELRASKDAAAAAAEESA